MSNSMVFGQASSGSNILVIAENEMTRKLISGMLRTRDYVALEAEGVVAASAQLIKMPLLAIVETHSDGVPDMGIVSRLPVILLTDVENIEAVRVRYGLPRTTVLKKPFTAEVLMACIERALAESGRVSGNGAVRGQEKFMRRAIDLSQEKMGENCGGPFGAVIVRGGEVIAEGWNQVTSSNDPTAHAEMVAIRKAAQVLGSFSLDGCEIYTSCEPCPMCLAAIYWARLERIFYGNTREDAGRIGFDDDFIYRELALPEDQRTLSAQIFLRDEAQVAFDNWMRKEDKTSY